MKYAAGNDRLEKYLNGHILGLKDAILAKCADCMNFFADGMQDCGINTCPLYLYQPYGEGAKALKALRKAKRERLKEEKK